MSSISLCLLTFKLRSMSSFISFVCNCHCELRLRDLLAAALVTTIVGTLLQVCTRRRAAAKEREVAPPKALTGASMTYGD